MTGDRSQNTLRTGWQALHVAIDNHTSAGFSLMHADEKATIACAFLLAALRYYESLGIKVAQVLTDNGSAYKLRRFVTLLRCLGIKHIRARPCTSRTNGKAEQLIQTLLCKWPTPSSTPAQIIERDNCSPRCTTTTSNEHTRPLHIAVPSLGLEGTTC